MSRCEDVADKLQGYLDDELVQQDHQQVRVHVDDCEACRGELADYRSIAEQVKGLKFEQPNDKEWERYRPHVGSGPLRGLGWMLLVFGIAASAALGAYAFLADPAVRTVEKMIGIAIGGGMGTLFLSVLWQRFKEAQTDRYRGVKK
jgi:anti-sigma factor RsiW